jgi:hypothetical protein
VTGVVTQQQQKYKCHALDYFLIPSEFHIHLLFENSLTSLEIKTPFSSQQNTKINQKPWK